MAGYVCVVYVCIILYLYIIYIYIYICVCVCVCVCVSAGCIYDICVGVYVQSMSLRKMLLVSCVDFALRG